MTESTEHLPYDAQPGSNFGTQNQQSSPMGMIVGVLAIILLMTELYAFMGVMADPGWSNRAESSALRDAVTFRSIAAPS